jgi:hypothetical protein
MINGRELDFTVIKQVITNREKVWVVQIRVKEELTSDTVAIPASLDPSAP